MRHYIAQANEVGLTEEELGAVQAIVMAVSAGKVNAQFRDALAGLDSVGAAPCLECSDSAQVDDQGRLVCAGMWGGIRNLDQDVTAGPLLASLHSAASDGGRGGDIYYFGVCTGGTLVRVAVADVMGHGEAVSGVSQYVYDSLRSHMCDPDSGVILSEINDRVTQRGWEAMTTAVVVAYDADAGAFHISSAGHPPLLLKRRQERTWSFLTVGDPGSREVAASGSYPLAVTDAASYGEMSMRADTGDRLLVYTDGVIEAPDGQAELFGRKRLQQVLDANSDAPLPLLKDAVLSAVRQHAGDELMHDDVTLIAMEVR
jgi:serine phosphatase RsbU (regulator of sigma subunit)